MVTMPDPVTSFILGQLARKLFGDAYGRVKEEIGGLLAENPVQLAVDGACKGAATAFQDSLASSLGLNDAGVERVAALLEDAAYQEAIGCLLVQAEPDRDRCLYVYTQMMPEGTEPAFDDAWNVLARSIEQSVAGSDELDRLARRTGARRRQEHERSIERTLGAIDDKLGLIVGAGSQEPQDTSPDETPPPDETPSADSGQVFISYRHVSPDEELANALDGHLRSLGVPVFLDKRIGVGTRWVAVIDRELRASAYFVPILSKDSIRSDMVRKEIELAYRLEQEGKLRILPIRASTLKGQLPYDLGAYLDPIQYALWHPAQGSDPICQTIAAAITGSELPDSPPTPDDPQVLVVPADEEETGAPFPAADPRVVIEHGLEGGAVRLSSPFYVEREADERMEVALRRAGTTLVVKGTRQSGKSSLLARAVALSRSRGHRTVYLDFQTFDDAQLESCEKLLYSLAHRVHRALRTALKPKEVWDEDIGARQSFADFLETAVLEDADEPVLLALDEVDRIFDQSYRAAFFSTVRSWHSNRAIREELWSKLDLALAHSTDPTLWIDDLTQSPFNVGERLRLEGFSPDEIADLNRRYGGPLTSPSEVTRLHDLVGGQPYLVRQALWVMVTDRCSLNDLYRAAFDDDGPFGDHLRHHLWVLHRSPLRKVVKRLALGKGCDDELDFQRLLAAGLLSGETRGEATLLCELYKKYFREHL